MAITVTWVEYHGANTPGNSVGQAATNINLGNVDTINLVPASYPVKVGEYSFFKQGKFNFSGSMTQINNVRIYKSAGVYKTQEQIEFSGGIAWATPSAVSKGWSAIATSLPGSANVILPKTTTGILKQADYESTPGYVSGARTGLVGFQLETTASTETGATNQKTISVVYDKQ